MSFQCEKMCFILFTLIFSILCLFVCLLIGFIYSFILGLMLIFKIISICIFCKFPSFFGVFSIPFIFCLFDWDLISFSAMSYIIWWPTLILLFFKIHIFTLRREILMNYTSYCFFFKFGFKKSLFDLYNID